MDDQPKFFFQEKYAKLGVKGKFGNIENLVVCISEVDAKTGRPLCSPVTCPVMSAGRSVVVNLHQTLY